MNSARWQWTDNTVSQCNKTHTMATYACMYDLHYTTAHTTSDKTPLPKTHYKNCRFSTCIPFNSFCVTSQVRINIQHMYYCVYYFLKYLTRSISTYSISIWLIQGAFLSDLVQFHIYLLWQNSYWISSQACDHHCTKISNIVSLTECSNPSSYSVLKQRVFLLLSDSKYTQHS